MKVQMAFPLGPLSSVSWDAFQSKLFVFWEKGEERRSIITKADLIANLITRNEPLTSKKTWNMLL